MAEKRSGPSNREGGGVIQDLKGEAKTWVSISLCPATQPYWLPALGDLNCSLGPQNGVEYPYGLNKGGLLIYVPSG